MVKVSKRIKWYEWLIADPIEHREFLDWKSKKNYKIRSLDRLAYLFFKCKYGMWWIKVHRADWRGQITPFEETVRTAKTPWIIKDGEVIDNYKR